MALAALPMRHHAEALGLREFTNGRQAMLVAIAAMTRYNRLPGKKILVSTNTFGASARNAYSAPRGSQLAVPA